MALLPEGTKLTWLGHATFLLEAQGKRVLLEAWTKSNPACPDELKDPGPLDLILLTHGHNDHTADVVELAQRTGAPVVCMVELGDYLQGKGIDDVIAMNKGGTTEAAGFKIHMTDAKHSSSFTESDGTIVYTGEPAGLVIELETGFKLYHAGDTCVFGDMALIDRLLAPDLAMLPIGDYYTMGPRSAAEAVRLLGVKTVIPMHYGTFPALVGTPDDLAKEAADVADLEIVHLEPGGSIGG